MGIENIINKACKMPAIYWGSPVNNGTGGKTFAEPIDVLVRWQDKNETLSTVSTKDADTVVSNAIIYSVVDFEELGWIALGSVDDLDSDQVGDPMSVEGAYEIQKFYKTPSIRANNFTRKTYV